MEQVLYFLIALLFIGYCELFGRTISYKLNIKFKSFYFSIGLISLLAIFFIFTSIFTGTNCSFYLILLFFILLTVFSFYLIIKNINKMDQHVSGSSLIFIIIFVLFALYYTYNTTFGDINGFDTTFYLNMFAGNMGGHKLNSIHYVWGNVEPGVVNRMYAFQSYYYYADCLYFFIAKWFNLLHINFYPTLSFVWTFQIVFFASIATIITETIQHFSNKKQLLLTSIGILMFFYVRYQFNSVYGFFGNTLKAISLSYASLLLYLYFKDYNKSYLYLFYCSLLATCAFTSTGSFISILFLFAAFFFIYEHNNNYVKECSIIIFPVFVDILTVATYKTIIGIPLSTIICLILFFFGNKLSKLIYGNKKVVLVLLTICMFIASRFFSNGLFDFSGFFSRIGTTYDMVLYFFNFSIKKGFSASNVYIIICDLLVLLNLIFKRNDKMMTIAWILIICFFNPFCCNFLSAINTVYYRAYEIILNPFTIIYMTNNIFEMIDNKTINYSISIIVLLVIAYTANLSKPMYYHESYVPSKDYNGFYRMDNDEIDVINELKVYCLDKENPRIITPNLLTQSMLQKGTYIFGRSLQINPEWSDAEKELYSIFYPAIYYNDPDQPANPDYDNYEHYLKKADIDYVVVDKSLMHYYPEEDNYYGLYYYLLRIGRDINVLYDNNSYLIISVNK